MNPRQESARLFAGACACVRRQTDAKQHKMNVWLPPLSYRVMLVVWQLGWVDIDLGYYTTCWAAGVMAEWAEQVGRLVEFENLSQLPDHQHRPVVSQEYLVVKRKRGN